MNAALYREFHRLSKARAMAPCAGFARARERGQALLVLIVMMSIATMLLVYGSTTEVSRAVSSDARTRAVLDEARQALIGRAVADANRPGSLPCPDGDDDGSADLFSGSACSSYIGRLPWRTLGVGDLRDDAGERLWYVLSPGFRDHPSAPPLNSDTRGTLTVYSTTASRVLTTHGVAIVLAPGQTLGGQRRDGGNALCNATARNVLRTRCVDNYLEGTGKASNASTAGPYVAAAEGALFNDRLALIVTGDLMPLVERRVVLETREALMAYRARAACRCYPWPATGAGGVSEPGTNRGRIPHASALPESWPPGLLPPYFARNEWGRGIYYAVGRQALEQSGKTCRSCANATLTLDGIAGYDVVLITPGYAQTPRSAWPDYIDDVENTNADDRFITPTAGGHDHDRTYPIAAAGASCTTTARVLIDNVPCGAPVSTVRAACQASRDALKSCSCAAAAATLTRHPCATSLGARECEIALTQLEGCTT